MPFFGLVPLVAALILIKPDIENKGQFDLRLVSDNAIIEASESDVYKKGSFDMTFDLSDLPQYAASGTSKGGDVPVVTG